jgi:hypothetical protein
MKIANLDPWINQNEEHIDTKTITTKFENHLLFIKAEHQNQIRPNLHHPNYIMNVMKKL